MTDYYELLGIGRDASDDDIKRAYKKLASKHHPDKGGDAEKFKEIKAAYDTLKDIEKKQQYDNPQQFQNHGFQFNMNGMPDDMMSQLFAHHNFFGQGFQQQRKNKDLRVSINVDLESTLTSQTKTISIQTTKGDAISVNITIPRGAENGTTIKYNGMGDNMFDQLQRGDLYVIIGINPNGRFSVLGNNLLSNLEIDSFEAMLGTEKLIETLDGKKFMLKITAGTQFGAKYAINGQGLYALNDTKKGDLVVTIAVKTPTLTDEQITNIRQLIG